MTITVITEDCSYEFKATIWIMRDDMELDISDGVKVVAAFSPSRWIAVYRTDAEVTTS